MTIEKLLRDLGAACARYQDEHLRRLTCQRVQCDEIWAFCYAKKKNVTAEIAENHPDAGDVWTWTAIDADSKLVLSWLVGSRDLDAAYTFMQDVVGRIRNRVQLTTDVHKPYLSAVEDAFGGDVDYAVLQKVYGADSVHGFFNDATPERYNKVTAEEAWSRTIAWFNKYTRVVAS